MGRWRNQKDREHNLTRKNLQKGGQTRFFFIKVQQKENFSSNKSRPKGMALKRSARHWAGFFFFCFTSFRWYTQFIEKYTSKIGGGKGRAIYRERERYGKKSALDKKI